MLHNQKFEQTALSARTPALEPPLMLTRDRINRRENFLLNRAHFHEDFFALYIVREGAGTHVIDDVPYLISRGDVYVMRPGSKHLYTQCRDLALDGLYFRPTIFDDTTLNDLAHVPGFGGLFIEEPNLRGQNRALRDKRDNSPVSASGRWLHLTSTQLEIVSVEIAELQAEWSCKADSVGRTSLIRSLLIRLIIHLARYYSDAENEARGVTSVGGAAAAVSPAQRVREATVNAAIKYMRDHLAEPLRIDQIAASVFLSPDHFSKVFSAVMGVTPNDHLRRLRVDEAKLLLTTTDVSITTVAHTVGFNQAAYFNRVFRALIGKTPREYRRESRSGSPPAGFAATAAAR